MQDTEIMKKVKRIVVMVALLVGGAAAMNAQTETIKVDRTKYPDYSDARYPDWSLMTSPQGWSEASRARSRMQRPDHVNNAETKFFPPVFNQDGGSCSAASRICYMFSYELAAYRDLDGSKPENYYPSHFIWLHWNSAGSYITQRNNFITKVGVPSAADYGGQTYSALFGSQNKDNEAFGWMQGYDKWYRAMHNRMLMPANYPLNMGTEEGREALKHWLWNHNGDTSFGAGGICGVDVAAADGIYNAIPQSETNDKLGVTGMYQVYEWGEVLDHSVTIVGYDDRIEFDIDKDGIVGEPDADEVGAWIIANSWGEWWCNNGFIYCPYAFGGVTFNAGEKGNRTFNTNSWWYPEVYKVDKDYRPLRTIKLEMDYSRRSEIALSAGISADLNATEPEKTVSFVHFTYAGDGNYGNSQPAPEVPMLGRWADGKLHTEPMEFGYDLTALTEGYDMSQPLKYFFIIDSRSWAEGEGTIHLASIIDYAYDRLGLETPFNVEDGVEVKNAGDKTIISVVVNGNSYRAPRNVAYTNGELTWQAPVRSEKEVASYNVYYNGTLCANVESTIYQNPDDILFGEYSVSALYVDGNESSRVSVRMPVVATAQNTGISLSQSGFSIPNIFASQTQQATIEYWMKPASLRDWNQSGGPGWGTFMFHANGDGRFTAGWDTSNRIFTNTPLRVGVWTHVAIVVDGSWMRVYLDGKECGYINSSNYSGIGGFGDLVFSSNGAQNAQDAVYDEIRVWNIARTQAQIQASKNAGFVGSIMPQGLIAYLKGETIEDEEGNIRLYDCVGGHHTLLHNNSYAIVNNNLPTIGTISTQPTISINEPITEVYAGIPVTLTATHNEAVCQLEWTAQGAGIERMATNNPTMIFTTAGSYEISVIGTSAAGRTVTATRSIVVLETPELDATFTATSQMVSAGERVTFNVTNPREGFLYQWSMPESENETAVSPIAATSYQTRGTYEVTLTVTAPNGERLSQTQQIIVAEVAPKAAFSITPAVLVKGEEVYLTDESLYTPTQWEWTINNGKNIDIVHDWRKRLVMNAPGVYDVTLDVANTAGSDRMIRERAIIVTNADSENGLTFSGSAAVTATRSPFSNGQSAFTIEWWMNSGWPSENINGIGDCEETLLLKTMGGGKMQLYVDGTSIVSSEDYVIPNEWHHYAVAYDGGSVKFYRDGMLVDSRMMDSGTSVPSLEAFRLGGSATPFKSSIDEFRVWGRALTEEQLRSYANEPIAEVADAESYYALKLYYDCNQSGGDVQDRTSSANHGVRTGFGPDGDAWGLSRGVFCLNFSGGATDATASYLINYEKSFSETGIGVNPNLTLRTYGLDCWTLQNTITEGSITTGAHVDRHKNSSLTVTTGWDGFAATLNDHKVFQTVTLPAGYYTFTAVYDDYFEGQCGSSYVVAAKGNTLPMTDELDHALAYTAMKPKGQAGSNSVDFLLAEETTVSVGLLVNMSGSQCMTIQKFTLMQQIVTVTTHEKEILPLNSIGQLQNNQRYYVSQPHHDKGLTSWAVQTGGEALKSNHDLSIEPDKDDARQQFAFVTADGGETYYLYHPTERKFVNRFGMLSSTPSNPIKFKRGAFDYTFFAYFDDIHHVNVGGSCQMIIDGWSTADGGNSCEILPVGEFDPTEALEMLNAPIEEKGYITRTSELDNNKLYHICADRGSLVVGSGGDALTSNITLGIRVDEMDCQQQFAILSKDGVTFYLYHVDEAMFVNKEGSLSQVPTDPIYFQNEEGEDYVMLYFDATHYINLQSWGDIVVNNYTKLDAGNNFVILPVGEFDPTEALKAFDAIDTGVEKTMDNKQQITIIYDLMGRRVEKATKGLYISNGKKMVIK